MPATEELSEVLIRENITRAVDDVFRTMVRRQIALSELPQGRPLPDAVKALPKRAPIAQIVGAVGFVGDINGLVYIHLDQPFADLCTSSFLGMSDFELKSSGDEVINDAIGELANMIVGSFKNGLCDAGYPCKLTIPSIVRGKDFSIEPTNSAQRHVYWFESGGHRMVTDILVKSLES